MININSVYTKTNYKLLKEKLTGRRTYRFAPERRNHTPNFQIQFSNYRGTVGTLLFGRKRRHM